MLIHIAPKFLDEVWPQVEPLLLPAVASNRDEATLAQVKMQLAYGQADLLLWEVDAVLLGAGVVEFVQHPNKRVAHVSYAGGRQLMTPVMFAAVKAWCRQQGASEIRALCGAAQARLFRRLGYEPIYSMIGVAL